jgi:hypothetical protein
VVFSFGKKISWFFFLEFLKYGFFFKIPKLCGFCILEKKVIWFFPFGTNDMSKLSQNNIAQ